MKRLLSICILLSLVWLATGDAFVFAAEGPAAAAPTPPMGVETWIVERKGVKGEGWIGVFNRTAETRTVDVSLESLGLDSTRKHDISDVWHESSLEGGRVELAPHDCVFLEYAAR